MHASQARSVCAAEGHYGHLCTCLLIAALHLQAAGWRRVPRLRAQERRRRPDCGAGQCAGVCNGCGGGCAVQGRGGPDHRLQVCEAAAGGMSPVPARSVGGLRL